MIKLRFIKDTPSFFELKSSWNFLLEKSHVNCFFLTWEWVSTWWEIYGTHFSLFILVAENEKQEIIGIAPMVVRKCQGKMGRIFRCLMFIGQDTDVTPEYLDFIINSNFETEVVALFAQAIGQTQRRHWDVMFMQRILDSSTNIPLFFSSLKHHKIHFKRHNAVICHYAELANTWDNFFSHKSISFRKRWNYNFNRLNREGEVCCDFVPTDVSLDVAYDILVKLNKERWGEQGASFQSDEYIRFHRLLCQKIEPLGWLVLVVLTQNSNVVAVKYDYLYGEKIWGNQGGWSREFKNLNVGEVLIGKLFMWAIEKGVEEYDFLGGDAEYKKRWGSTHRYMNDWTAYNSTWRGRAFESAAFVKNKLKLILSSNLLKKLKLIKTVSAFKDKDK